MGWGLAPRIMKVEEQVSPCRYSSVFGKSARLAKNGELLDTQPLNPSTAGYLIVAGGC